MNGITAFTMPDVSAETARPSLAIVGMGGDEHLAGSLMRAAERLGVRAVLFDAADAWRGPRLHRAFNWRFRDRRPPAGASYAAALLDALERGDASLLIATGLVPLEAASLRKLRKIGITTINYSTDDPWNPHMASRWFQRSLPEYDVICTPRRANIGDFERLGCRDVRYLPFGYDERLLAPGAAALGYDVLFVGGADADRARFVRQFRRHGVPVTLVGGYWHRYRDLRSHALGMKSWAEVAALTRAAKISLCLVRRANRDGHVMRSLEIAACGGCMLAEDTADHRAFFGPDGETVRYFTGAEDAARRAHALLLDSVARQALAERLRLRILRGKHTYADRLASMLQAASSAMRRRSVGAGAALRC